MRNSSSMPGCRSLASRYCCIIGVVMGQAARSESQGSAVILGNSRRPDAFWGAERSRCGRKQSVERDRWECRPQEDSPPSVMRS